MIGRSKAPLEKGDAAKPVKQIVRTIRELETKARTRGAALAGVGICIPGIVYARGGHVWAPNIPGWDQLPLRNLLAAKTKIPIVLDSDRSAYVLGERWRGVARRKKDVVFLAVGTGIGAGILTDGRVCRGSEGIAGAVGWFALDPRWKSEYATMGCFEAEASGGSIGRKARELVRAGEAPLMASLVRGKIDRVTAETVIRATRLGDAVARHILDQVIVYLAMGIANIVSILNPEMIVLGGGLFRAGDLLLPPIKKEFRKWAQPLAARKVRIELSALGENAGLFGAGKLAWESIQASLALSPKGYKISQGR
jgi:glucokinase